MLDTPVPPAQVIDEEITQEGYYNRKEDGRARSRKEVSGTGLLK